MQRLANENDAYRLVAHTGEYDQIVVMCIKAGDEIGNETHRRLDQYLRVESGQARVTAGRKADEVEETYELQEGWGAHLSAGLWHNIINVGSKDLRLTVHYSPPRFPPQTVHETKADAEEAAREVERGMAEASGFGA